MAPPPKPERHEPTGWEHYDLWKRVHEAILALPVHFRSETVIEGMLATDIFTLNSALGATIEEQVVSTLNALRPVWDPDKQYLAYGFVRQTQTFPDVLLRKKTNGQDILLGIELKGWYILAEGGGAEFSVHGESEGVPWDLIVVVPWALSNVLAGSPVVYPVFIDLSGYTAEQRNYYWQTASGKGVTPATGATVYPIKSDKISDKPAVADGNFGRLARYGIMEKFVQDTMGTPIRGVPAVEWLRFLQAGCSEGTLSMTVDRLGGLVENRPTARANFLQRVDELVAMEQTVTRLAARLRAGEAVIEHYDAAADKLIAKVDAGLARSRETYSDLKAVRNRPAYDAAQAGGTE